MMHPTTLACPRYSHNKGFGCNKSPGARVSLVEKGFISLTHKVLADFVEKNSKYKDYIPVR